jgi:pilus assembly protein CpaE
LPDPGFAALLEAERANVIVVEIRDARQVQRIADALQTLAQPPALFAVANKPEPELILAAMRAGAKEFLYSPLGAQLSAALERFSPPAKESAGRLLALLSSKGGCGATTVACHMAAELARQSERKTLLADLDIHAGLAGFLMNVQSPYSLRHALENTQKLDRSYWAALVSPGPPSLEILQAPALEEMPAEIDENALRKVLAFLQGAYSCSVLDLGRGLGAAALRVLDPAAELFVVTTLDLPALHLAKQLIKALVAQGRSAERIQLILNRVSRDPDVTPQEVEAGLGVSIYGVLPDDQAAIQDALGRGKLAHSGSSFAKEMARLVSKLCGSAPAARKRRFAIPFMKAAAL